jgi:penicillin-insensitive murein endopeptidase
MPHPLDGKSSKDLETALLGNHDALGSMSIGSPNAGKLFAATRMPESEHWTLVDAAHAWGTRETVDALARCIEIVNAKFPHTTPVFIGHISADRGGPLSPHVSHQAGRDADVGYYYLRNAHWYTRADAKNLDRARTWAFVRALITETDVELILIDHSIQRLLEEHARTIGEDPAWLDGIFRGSGKVPPLIRHANGHATHLHVRFYSPLAQETARRALDILVRHDLIEPPQQFVHHRAKDGETLAMLARKYGTTIGAIRTANRLKTNKIRAKKTYLIPRRAALRLSSTPVAIPPRRLPPRAPIG